MATNASRRFTAPPALPGVKRTFTAIPGKPGVEVPNPRFTAFSRASHFAILLVPAFIALSWVISRDGDTSVLIQLQEVFALILGVGGAVGVLYAVEYVADHEM